MVCLRDIVEGGYVYVWFVEGIQKGDYELGDD